MADSVKKNEREETLRDELKELMEREIRVMRELLNNMQLEQEAHLNNATERLRSVLRQREPIVITLSEIRQERLDNLKQLTQLSGKEWPSSKDKEVEFVKSIEYAGQDCCDVILLRDQMLALLSRLKNLTERNNYLIKHKVEHTKDMLHSLAPQQKGATYTPKGNVTVKTATLPVLNQEV